MNNEELVKALKRLKKDGVSYKYLSEKCGIPLSTFYQYSHRETFPYETREKISRYILNNFSEVIWDE